MILKSLTLILLVILNSPLQANDSFRNILKDVIQKDPTFREIDLQTPFYEAQFKQGVSKLFLPRVGLSYGTYDQNQNINTFNQDPYRLGSLTATLDVFSFGSDWETFQFSRLERKAQVQRVNVRLLERELELGLLLLDYLKGLKNVAILTRLVELKEKSADVSKKRYERGSLSEQDLNKVKLDVSNARGELMVSQNDYNRLLARIQAYGLETPPTEYPWQQELSDSKIDEISKLSTEVSDLPQFKEAALTQEASDHRSDAFRNLMLGRVQLNFSRSVYDFQDTDQWEWRTSLVYVLPLFDQFNEYTAFKQADVFQRVNEVRRKLNQSKARTNQIAENANLKISWKNWVERSEALKISSKLYTHSLSQFNQGTLSVNELFVDQDRLLRTEQIANFTLHQLHASVLAFCHSRGVAYVQGCF